MRDFVNKIEKIHFIGIGGIGVSGLAKIFLWQGKKVSGSDLVSSKNVLDLKKLGANIFIGSHRKENISQDLDLVVCTQAAEDNNPEIQAALEKKIKILTYPQVLGQMTREKFAICVSGTHGKTTTTSMSSLLLENAGLDPTCIIGSNLKEFDGNAHLGKSKYFVLEADEYKGAFLNYRPKIVILTTIEYEHPDYFKNLEHELEIFSKYVKNLPKDGVLIANSDDKHVMKVAKSARGKVVTYGIKNRKANFLATDIKLADGWPKFLSKNQESGMINFELKIPGIHNVYNALAAIALSSELKIDLKIAKNVLENFYGAWRRFEYKKVIRDKNIVIIDDYAHHPTEIRVTLRAARERFPKHKIICVFQPHQVKRTKILFRNFVKVFFVADEVVLTDIYAVAGRDSGAVKEDSKKLADALKNQGVNVKYIDNFDLILRYIKKRVKKNCLIITMGAGDITKLSTALTKKLK